jgi:hypothetical protein
MNHEHSPPTTHRSRLAPLLPWLAVGGLVVGLGLGVAVGVGLAASDPTDSSEYRGLQAEVGELEADLDFARKQAAEAGADLALYRVREQELAGRAAELDQREQAVAGREAAVTAVEAQVAARSVGEGTWTVGVDIEPDTYRTQEAVGRAATGRSFARGRTGTSSTTAFRVVASRP